MSWGARGPGGAKRPGDVCTAPTEVERRPSVLRRPKRSVDQIPLALLKQKKRNRKVSLFLFYYRKKLEARRQYGGVVGR